MLEKTKGVIMNGQYRETGNIGYTRRRQTNIPETLATLGTQDHHKQTIQRHWQHWVQKTTTNKPSRDTGNIGYIRRRQTKNPEKLATLGTQDDNKQTNKQTQHNHYTETNTNK